MTDEKYIFITDVRDKKRTARGAFNKRSHAGKGGRVRMPSDFMSQKEIKAMSGEVKSYRLNEPVSWKEYKTMPDDIRKTYILMIREKFGVPDVAIGEMLGVSQNTISIEMRRLGICKGRGNKKEGKLDVEGFNAWCERMELPVEDTDDIIVAGDVTEDACEVVWDEIRFATPTDGCMEFKCNADEAMETIKRLLGNARCKITVEWDLMGE